VVACGVLLTLTLLAVPAWRSYSAWAARQELKLAAERIATYILREQSYAIWSGLSRKNYLLFTDKKSFYLYRPNRPRERVMLSADGSENIICTPGNLSHIDFLASGSPSRSGSLKLEHAQLSGEKYFVLIKPVTGQLEITHK